MLSSEFYLYYSVVNISNVLKVTTIKLITQSALLRHMCHNSEPVKQIVLDTAILTIGLAIAHASLFCGGLL